VTSDEGATYRQAGVDIDAGARAVELIKESVRSTFRPEVLTDIGGFGGLFKLAIEKYREPVLVSGTDGVGTKLKIAQLMDRHDTVGIDLVAMCANDILCSGAEPLFFLDYVAIGKLVPEKVQAIVEGIATGCRHAGCALLGGETAEHPGVMPDDDYDLAGFVVGVVERDRIVDGSRLVAGDVFLGLGSSGLHSNGFSLVRGLFLEDGDPQGALARTPSGLGRALGDELLEPTELYVRPVLDLLKHFDVRAIAHITGGGVTENVARVMPPDLAARVHKGSWRRMPIFDLIAERGKVSEDEMYRTFNMGLGLVLALPPEQSDDAAAFLAQAGLSVSEVGDVIEGEGGLVYA
jgi:phosphoribosylformylglycinamidine cyclo-ligase